MPISTVLLDLDGVVRHFDPAHVASVEEKHGLAPGILMERAFEADLLHSVITGGIPRVRWVEEVGLAVDSPSAAEEWMAERGVVDLEMLIEVDKLRSSGVVVAVLTNGTDTIPAEMKELKLVDRFDAIFSTSQIGYAKPDRRAFEHVCKALEVDPALVFFTDDSESKLAGAIELGMTARQFVGVDTFRQHLGEFGLSV